MTDQRIPAVLVDIDGVLCDVPYNMSHDPEEFSWDDFMESDLDRRPISAGITLVRMMRFQGLKTIFLTARPEFMRVQTRAMLKGYGLVGDMYMASDSTTTQVHRNYQATQAVEKDRIIDEFKLTERYNFLYAIDDQEHNIKVYQSWGIPTLKAGFV